MASNKFTNDNDSIVDDKPTTTTLPPSPSTLISPLTTLLASHATLTHSHATLRKAYRALELELRWYSDMYIGAHADLQAWQAACRALEAERDAVSENARLGLKAKRGPFGGRLWGKEKMGEVWKMQGEFVWVKVEERDWGRVLGLKAAREGVERGARKVRECLGEVREKCREKCRKGRRGRSVVPVALRRVLT